MNRGVPILIILDEIGPLKKERRLQLLVYHLQETDENVNTNFGFEKGRYGPHSLELRKWIEGLDERNFINRTKHTGQFEYAGSSFGQHEYYSFSLTEKGKKVLRNEESSTVSDKKEINKYSDYHLADLIEEFANKYPNMVKSESPFSR